MDPATAAGNPSRTCGPRWATARPRKVADIFQAFDASAAYDKARRRQAATRRYLTAELVAENETPSTRGGVGEFVRSGAGFEHIQSSSPGSSRC
jgi:hypothetical protein